MLHIDSLLPSYGGRIQGLAIVKDISTLRLSSRLSRGWNANRKYMFSRMVGCHYRESKRMEDDHKSDTYYTRS